MIGRAQADAIVDADDAAEALAEAVEAMKIEHRTEAIEGGRSTTRVDGYQEVVDALFAYRAARGENADG